MAAHDEIRACNQSVASVKNDNAAVIERSEQLKKWLEIKHLGEALRFPQNFLSGH